MCAVGVSESGALDLLEGFESRVQLAAVNSPTSCTLSGNLDAVQELVEICGDRSIFCRELRVDVGRQTLVAGGSLANID